MVMRHQSETHVEVAYGVLDWQRAAFTVTGAACFDNGRFAVADPRPLPNVTIEEVPRG